MRMVQKYDRRLAGEERAVVDEPHYIGEDTADKVYLTELPLRESPSTVSVGGTPDAGGSFVEVTTIPEAGEFRVRYDDLGGGSIDFHEDDAGIDVTVSYKGRGSVLNARDFNILVKRVNREELDPVDFGAREGGSIDCATAFQACIDEADGAEKGIVVGPGIWRLESGLTYASHLMIRGMSPEVVRLKFYGVDNAFSNADVDVRRYNLRMKGLNLRAESGGAIGIDCDNVSTSVFQDMIVHNFPRNVRVRATNESDLAVYNRFLNVKCSGGNQTHGISLERKSANGNLFIGCRVISADLAVSITEVNGNTFIGCQFESNTDAVKIETPDNDDTADHNSFITCRFENNSGNEVNIPTDGVRDAQFFGCQFPQSPTIVDNGTRTRWDDGRAPMKFGYGETFGPDYTITNPVTNRSVNVSTASAEQVRQIVGTMLQDFIDYRLFR